jgi:hypothetical protein
MNAATRPPSLSDLRQRATARERRTEYLAHAYACHDMALCALDADDQRLLRGMTMVWRMLANKNLRGVGNAAPPRERSRR